MERTEKVEILREKAEGFAEKIAPVYQVLGWKWINKIPSKEEILDKLTELINHIEKGRSIVSTGGLEVYIDESEPSLGIRFIYDDVTYL